MKSVEFEQLKSAYRAVGSVKTPPVKDVLKLGRSMATKRRWIATGVGALTMLLLGASLSALWALNDGDSQPTGPVDGSPVSTDQVAVFANRAMADADLVDATGRLFDYRSTKKTASETWSVYFGASSCSGLPKDWQIACHGPVGVSLEVTLDQERILRISRTMGPLDEAVRSRLLGYEAVAPPLDHPQWEGLSVAVSDFQGGAGVEAVPLWVGTIPAPDAAVSSRCSAEVEIETGETVRSEVSNRPPPTREEMRSGSIWGFQLPIDVRADQITDASVTCSSENSNEQVEPIEESHAPTGPIIDIQKESPLGGGEKLTLEQLLATEEQPVPVPPTNAETGDRTAIWSLAGQIAFVWENDMRYYINSGGDTSESQMEAGWREKARRGDGELVTVQDSLAIGHDLSAENPANLSFVDRGFSIQFVSPAHSLDQLVEFADLITYR